MRYSFETSAAEPGPFHRPQTLSHWIGPSREARRRSTAGPAFPRESLPRSPIVALPESQTSAIKMSKPSELAFEAVEDRAAQEPSIPGLPALADDDDLDGVLAGEGQDRAGDVLAAKRHGDAAELLGQLEVLADQALGGRVDPRQVFRRGSGCRRRTRGR